MAALSLLAGPQDPSQLDATINTLIAAINPILGGSVPVPNQTTLGTSSANLGTFGTIILNSTATNSAYTLPNPTAAQLGQQVELILVSTKGAAITGKYDTTKTKISLSTTASAATAKFPAVTLTALSTTRGWGVTSAFGGTIKTT